MTNNDRVHVRLGDDDGLRFRFVPDVEATHEVPPELAERSNIPQRTVRYAGTRLQEETDVLESRKSTTDARETIYELTDE